MNRVVITGLGLVSSLGTGVVGTWDSLLAAERGIHSITSFDASSLDSRAAGEVRDLDAEVKKRISDRRILRNMIRNDRLATLGALLAVEDARLGSDDWNGEETGLFIAGNKEISDPSKVLDAVLTARNDDGSADFARMGTEGADRFYPLFYVEGLQAAALFYISKVLDIKGPNSYLSGSSDAGMSTVDQGFRTIRRGEVPVALVGGFDDTTSWWNVSKRQNWGVLADGSPTAPYDAGRAGAAVGEGSAFLVLEERDHALDRGARIYAEVCSTGRATDTGIVFTPAGNGRGLASALRTALSRAELNASDIDCLVGEGNATPDSDAIESGAVTAVFADHSTRLSMTATTGSTGHLSSASGIMNTAVACLSLYHQQVPPVAGLAAPDPTLGDIGWVVDRPAERSVSYAMAVAQGYEGQSAAVVLGRSDPARGDLASATPLQNSSQR